LGLRLGIAAWVVWAINMAAENRVEQSNPSMAWEPRVAVAVVGMMGCIMGHYLPDGFFRKKNEASKVRSLLLLLDRFEHLRREEVRYRARKKQ